MYYTVIKHNGHLRTRGKCRKQEPQASVFYISTFLYDEVMWPKTIKHAFSKRAQGSIYIIKLIIVYTVLGMHCPRFLLSGYKLSYSQIHNASTYLVKYRSG